MPIGLQDKMKITKRQLRRIIREAIDPREMEEPLGGWAGNALTNDPELDPLKDYSDEAVKAAAHALKRVPKWALGGMVETEVHEYLETIPGLNDDDLWTIANEALSVAGIMNGHGPDYY